MLQRYIVESTRIQNYEKELRKFQNLCPTRSHVRKKERNDFLPGSKYRSNDPPRTKQSLRAPCHRYEVCRPRVALLFQRNFPVLPILVNDRSRLTYHCSRAIITFAPGRNQKRSRSINGEEGGGKEREDRCSWNRFNPLNTEQLQSDLC